MFENEMLNPYEIYKSESTKTIFENDNSKVNTTAYERYGFELLAPSASEDVKAAWDKAAKKTGVNNGDDSGSLTHINAMFTLQLQDKLLGRGNDFLGNSKETAIAATKRALYLMLNSPSDGYDTSDSSKEIAFYNAFLDNLNNI